MRREAAKKTDASTAALVCVATALALHPPAVLWMLQSRQLWRSFVLLTPSAVLTVSPAACSSACSAPVTVPKAL